MDIILEITQILNFTVSIILLLNFFVSRRCPRPLKKFGYYTLIEQIGKGGMATIHLARNHVLKRIVAVKILNAALTKKEDTVNQFLGEGEILTRINNEFPNSPVVKVIEYGYNKSKGIYFVSMDYLEGLTLSELMKSTDQLDLNRKLHIIREMARALHCSHSLKIYHRDIAPENILIDEEIVTLIDFGVALFDPALNTEVPNISVGRPFYMSPEQGSGKAVSNKSDIYSLGAVLFYLLEGSPPYQSNNPYEAIKMHIYQPIPFIKKPAPPELCEFVYKMLDKNPDLRPDALEVEEKMDYFLKKET